MTRRAAALFVLGLPSMAEGQELPTMPPAGYYEAVASNPQGNVDNVTYGSDYVARIYTPPGYSENQQYPVMYLMHGMGGSERSWHDNDLYAHVQLDNLIAEGVVEPFIMVFTRNDYNSWDFARILIDELIPYVESNYSACPDPENRALGGLSMGGMQTINIGFPNAELFHYLMPSSSAPGIQGEGQLFPDGGEVASQNLNLVFFSCGSEEVGAYGCNGNATVRGYMESLGLGDIIEEHIVPGGAHNAATWRPSFWNFAQLAHQAGFTTLGTMCGGDGTGGADGTGGTDGSGGDVGVGGAEAAGGAPSNGGAEASGGDVGVGGAEAAGGAPSNGGAEASGGAPNNDGAVAAGGGSDAPGSEDVEGSGGAVMMRATATPPEDAGCGCRTAPRESRGIGAWLALALLWGFGRTRSRRR